MVPLVVVIKPMVFSYSAGVAHAHEPIQIQAFIPELAVETLHVGIIDWFPRADERDRRTAAAFRMQKTPYNA